jgi:hypothetical protein
MTAQEALRHPFIVGNCGLVLEPISPLVTELAAHTISTSAPTSTPIQTTITAIPFDRVSSAPKAEQQKVTKQNEIVGRPLGQKTAMDDSGVVTSNETLAREKQQQAEKNKKPSIFGHKVSGITTWFRGKSSQKLDRA